MQAPKGTFDILPYKPQEPWQLSHLWQYIESLIHKITGQYCYKEIRTPIYEMTSLFDRGVGETSDIVMKEMFTFQDKGDRSITLRPEGTSAVMRSLIQNRLFNEKTVHKLFYIGPMFRHERPQSGRYRQHHQFGIEAIGNGSAEQDAEAIDMLLQFYRQLGLKNLSLQLNSVGDAESRSRFKAAFLDYVKPYTSDLSDESKVRLEKNPLRILDSKDSKDREIVKGAPSILEFLSQDAKEHFEKVQKNLTLIGVDFKINPLIVRGLDYYNKTVFEVLTTDLGAQNTIGAGGRFDGLISTLGGPDLPAVGWATGLERVLQVMVAQQVALPEETGPLIYFIPLGEEAVAKCFELVTKCRHAGLSADIELHAKKMQTAIQNGVKNKANFCAIVGSEELQSGKVQLKNLQTREQRAVGFDQLVTSLTSQKIE